MAAPEQIFARLQSLVGDAVRDLTLPAKKGEDGKDPGGARDAFCKVVPERWHEVAAVLRDDPELQFDFCQCITAVDWPKQEQLQVVYHFYSYTHRHPFVVKADLPRANPVIPSVADLWGAAEWNEREQFDLLGVGFSGHPDLRRVMMPDDWVGHPMRKDWKEPAHYRGMSTTRPSPLELLPAYDKVHLPLVVPTPDKPNGDAPKPKPATAAAGGDGLPGSEKTR
jgi:NADH-quinone oxidoreductase subunit C